jgi:hypothetical protein
MNYIAFLTPQILRNSPAKLGIQQVGGGYRGRKLNHAPELPAGFEDK